MATYLSATPLKFLIIAVNQCGAGTAHSKLMQKARTVIIGQQVKRMPNQGPGRVIDASLVLVKVGNTLLRGDQA
ncbi:MAG: hypothetical protein ABI612_15220 [Betaproteobacteria bacterium]